MRSIPFTLLFLSLATSSLAGQDPDSPSVEGEGQASPRNYLELFRPLDLPTPNDRRTAMGAPGPDYWQQKVDYQIEASLDEETQRISGREVITYINNSPHSLPFLWLSLDQNIFRPESLSAQISGRQSRTGRTQRSGLGFTIEAITAGGKHLEIAEYDTLARVECPEPIPARGGRFEFEIRWSFTVPSSGLRMGVAENPAGDIFALANWFPAVAVYDDVNGWNTLPYLGQGEFFQNFGNYEVALTVPRDHVVAATGMLQNANEVLTAAQAARLNEARTSAETVLIRTTEDVKTGGDRPKGQGPLTWRFKAENVRTFAWASSRSFVWDAAGLEGTLLQSLYPPNALLLWREATQMLKSSIEGFSRRWFRYPYPAASNINAMGVGGMEYPMIIFNGRERTERGLYFLIAHEIGHQWFPMIVNSDERRHPWMDEGFNMFIDYYAMLDRFGSAGVEYGLGTLRVMKRMARRIPVITPPDRGSEEAVQLNAYMKPARVLIMLREQVLGPERFDRAFRDYIAWWAFKQPKPADFYRAMDNGAGVDLAWFWRQWFYENREVDLAIERAEVETVRNEKRLRIVFKSLGDGVMPLAYTITLEDGATLTGVVPVDVWSRSDTKVVTVPLGGEQVPVKVEIDAAKLIPDSNRRNNLHEFERSER